MAEWGKSTLSADSSPALPSRVVIQLSVIHDTSADCQQKFVLHCQGHCQVSSSNNHKRYEQSLLHKTGQKQQNSTVKHQLMCAMSYGSQDLFGCGVGLGKERRGASVKGVGGGEGPYSHVCSITSLQRTSQHGPCVSAL